MEIVDYVNKYKRRLHPHNDIKKIKHALQRLDDLEMTVDVLKETGIGKTVNNFRKLDTVGELAKCLVAKWKLLLAKKTVVNEVQQKNQIKYDKKLNYSPVNENSNEYDPSKNWNMNKKISRDSSEENNEYDPNENWEMKSVQSSSHNNEYDPTQNWEMKQIKKEKQESMNTEYFPQKKSKEKKKLKNKDRYHKEENKHYPNSPQKSNHNNSDYYQPKVSNIKYEMDSDSDQKQFNQYVFKNNSDSSDDNLCDNKSNSSHRNVYDTTNSYSPSKTEFHKSTKENNKFSGTKNKRYKEKTNITKSVNLKPPQHKEESCPSEKNSLNNDTKSHKHSSTSSSKRKSTSEISNSSSKKQKFEKVKTKSKDSKKSAKNNINLSFEDFMAMDTSKLKNKKVNKVSTSLSKKATSSGSRVKLDLHLPEVQANYFPLPHHEPKSHNKTPAMTDAIAAELHTQRNTKRMQIYSGQKTSTIPNMMSLYDQCMNVLVNNIDCMDVIGVPYDIIKPVLERCTVEQLYRLEDCNGYLLEDTDDLWYKHAQNDFKNNKPDEMESWREMYLRLHDAREVKLTKLTHSIQAKLNKAKPLESRTKLAYVGIGQAKAPRNVQRAQLKYGTAGPKPYSNSTSSGQGSSSIKNQVSQLRRAIPVGSITANSVDNMHSGRMKKFVPKKAPMLAKTLNSINKMRYRR